MIERTKEIPKKLEDFWMNTAFRIIISENLYLVLFAVYMLHYYFGTTMFQIQWPNNFLAFLHLSLMITILFRYISTNVLDLKHTLLILISFSILLIAYQHVNYTILLTNALLIIGACEINYRKIFKVYLIVSIPITLYTIIASQTGTVTNLIYNQEGRIRESFGFIYPTDFAAHIFFIVIVWVLLRQWKCTYVELGIMVLLTVFLHFNCDTRCSEITILLIVGWVAFLKIRIAKKKSVNYQLPLPVKCGCLLLPFVFMTSMTFLCRFYNPDNYIMSIINKILSDRLKLGKRTFDNYDTTLLGQYIEMVGNGGTTEKPAYYTFIDCSYINILMRFGLLVFIVVLLLIEVTMLKNINNAFILIALVIICMHSMIEHHLFEFYYNIFIILPLASFSDKEHQCVLAKKYVDKR